VRRFYPDRIVMHDHGAYGPAPAPVPVPEPVPAGSTSTSHGDADVPAGELRPLEEVGGER